MSSDVEAIVVGAGVVGLAVARELARRGTGVLVLEQHERIGTEISSRNSGVIHAGIYYEPGSLKARLCVRGKELLYGLAAEHGFAHRRTGKLLVATGPEQHGKLAAIHRQAERSGVTDLVTLSAADARALEPEVTCTAALLSPSTGVVDPHGFMLALQGEAEANGAGVVLQSPVVGLAREPDGGFRVDVGGAEAGSVRARMLVLAAGLHQTTVASLLAYSGDYYPPPTTYARGRYYALRTRSPFRHLVYPMPDGVWLGIHLTLDVGGRARFGPDMVWIEGIDYGFDPSAEDQFYTSIRRYWPGLPDGALVPDQTGIRPKLYRDGEPAPDFQILGAETHGLAGLVTLMGIESPGLTSSMAIAEVVADRLAQD